MKSILSATAGSVSRAGVVLALLIAAAQFAFANVIVYEGFNYGSTNGSMAGKGSAGNGWAGAWVMRTVTYTGSPTFNEAYQAGGLTFSDLAVIGGNAFISSDGDGFINLGRQHSASVTGTLYGAYLFRSAAPSFTTLYALFDSPSLDISTNFSVFSIEPDAVNNLNGGVIMGGSYTYASGTAISANETYLVLFKVANLGPTPANQAVTMWILRASQYDFFKSGGIDEAELNAASLGASSTQVLQRAARTTSNTAAQFASGNFLALESFFNGQAQFDEIRISDASLNEALTATGSPSCVTPPANMVSWHPGDGNPNDIQGGNHGTLLNGTAFAAGKVGQAFSFDGSDDKVSVPNSASLNITGNQLTLDAWVRPSASGSHRQVVSKASGPTGPEHQYGFYVTVDNRLGFEVVTTAGRVDAAAGSIPNNVFTHIAGTYDGSAMKFYIDGNLVHTQPHTGAIVSNTGDLTIGQYSVGGFFPFNGLIDEVEIFNRTLTHAEIQAIFNAGANGKCKTSTGCTTPPSNMVSWHSGDGNPNDIQGSNHGTLQNGAGFAAGTVGQAFNFDGSNDYVDIGDKLDRGTADFTIETWIKGDPTMNAWARIIDKGFASGFSFHKVSSSNKVGFEFLASGNGFSTTSDVIDNTWHHVAVVKAGTVITIYADGVAENSGTVSSASQNNARPLLIGYNPGEGTLGYWKGQIDELSIYDRALTPAEVQAIFNAGSAGKCKAGGPTPTPGSGQIVFDRSPANSPNTPNIWLMNQDGSNQVQLTSNAMNFSPKWSPDATKIAFTSNRDGNLEIYVMNADGTNQVRLTNNFVVDLFPTWSPDGTKIVFASDPGEGSFNPSEIYVMNADGSNRQRLTTRGGSDLDPAWSPNGLNIAFSNGGEIYVMNSDGTNAIRLNNTPGRLPAWSPDGTKIAFATSVSTDGVTTNVAVMNANGTNVTMITNYQNGSVSAPAWSPDASRISFSSDANNTSSTQSDIYLINPDGSNLTRITNDPGFDLTSHWKPVVQPAPTTLANISTRLKVETGDNILIGGFIVTGTQDKKVIIRAIGPSLSLAGKLANPTLQLFTGSTLLASNDDWQNSTPADRQAIIDSTIPPAHNLESAIVRTLPANGTGYTAVVRGVNNTTGIAVVEAYDLDRSANSKLANISTRGLVQTGDNVLIAGTIVVGQSSQRVIVRAIGPSLAGVPGKMENPTLELRGGNGELVAANDNWRTGGQEAEIIATTIPPANELESAIVATLSGNGASYTAIVRGVGDTTGIAVVEVYALN